MTVVYKEKAYKEKAFKAVCGCFDSFIVAFGFLLRLLSNYDSNSTFHATAGI
jgi:hypothetical protein